MNSPSTHPAHDPDLVAAMHEVDDFLKGEPSRFLLLPAPAPRPPVLTPFSVPTAEHAFNPECRTDVLDRIAVRKTTRPGVREVLFDGVQVGRIARNIYGVGWVASCSRKLLFWSISDAALALVEDAGVLP